MNTRTLCLCGSGIEYHHCCRPFHSGEKIPATAEALMRSRYTAHALHNAAYLQETWDATKRPEKIDFSKEKINWLRLEITDTKKGGVKDSKGVVVFKAFYMQDGEEHVMNEISRFTKINGHLWPWHGVTEVSLWMPGSRSSAPCSCPKRKKSAG